jgi:trans-2,3-dihydro-3-hydroxyanthranilate isomerase
MQSLAKEMNLAETTFVLRRDPATEKERGVRVRIFTVSEEMPFAGHPTLGTAMVLRGNNGAKEIVLDLNVGKIPVQFSEHEGHSFGVMAQNEPQFGQKHSRDDVARATGLAPADIADDVPIQSVSTGNNFVMVPVKSLAVLQKLAPAWPAMHEYLKRTDGKFFYFVSRETVCPEAKMQVRMFFYNGEDPATGSAAGPCIAWAVHYKLVPPDQQILIEQGVELKRRSRIFARAGQDGGKIVNVRVGGHAVEVMRGEALL